MNRSRNAAAGLVYMCLLSACNDLAAPPPASAPHAPIREVRPVKSLIDGAHGGNAHFFFLPPMVSQPKSAGTFDAALSPSVTICALAQGTCGTTVATFTTTTGPGDQVRADAVAQHYLVNWNTRYFTLDLSKIYRITVRVLSTELGHADVALVSGSARNTATGETITLVDGRTLPIRFSIEKGALAVVSASNGGTALLGDGKVEIVIPAGATTSDIAVTATNVPVGADGTDTSVLFGTLYQFEPSPTEFAHPVALTLTYSSLPPSSHADRLVICKMIDGACVPIAGSYVDVVAHTVTAQISSFSEYGITEWPQFLRSLGPYQNDNALYTSSGDVMVIPGSIDYASWSPDGMQIAYSAFMDFSYFQIGCQFDYWSCRREIRKANWDGTGATTLIPAEIGQDGNRYGVQWSPIGDKILFALNRGGTNANLNDLRESLLVTDATGINTALTIAENVNINTGPSFRWSPDGIRVVFTGVWNGDIPNTNMQGENWITIVNADGTDLHRVTPGHAYGIDWSPDGSKIVFVGSVGDQHGLYLCNADGSNVIRLVPGESLRDVSWSGAQNLILWSQSYGPGDDDGGATNPPGIYVIRGDGTGLRLISPAFGDGLSPAWLPDGSRLSFRSEGQHWLVNSDGTGLQPIANSGNAVFYWRP